MILGPDGKPIMNTTVIGAPKLSDFPPVPPAQLPVMLRPLEEALASGVHASTPTEVPLGTLCMLGSSLQFYMAEAKRLTDELAELKGEALAEEPTEEEQD